ncbi:protein FAM189B isoform X2 [Carassius auratus]|uniref:Protein FAM189B isoform X2 n=1 Tax=Carassius auratus TaxID=7957 RepID=A0A6P6R6L3_CARAU|nr:protein FAM189B-like isoform X2 [Carassius auratus]
MPSPSDSSSVASMSGSRALSGSRRRMSGRTSARVLLYLGLCHLALGAMVLAFSFTSLAFTSSPRVRQSCPFWAGFFVVASGVVGVISWRRPFTLVVHSHLCLCCDPKQKCSITEDEALLLYRHSDCHSVRHRLKDLLFSACGLSILSTIICTLSTVTCSIHIFSLDLLHLLAPHRSRSVNPECTTPQDAFLSNMMDFEEFVPPIPPPPYYPPEYTCSSETDAQSVTYNGSMESPVPLYPTDCPPPYEAVMGQRAPSQATVYDTQANELSGERGTSIAFSGEVSMDSGSLLMSEIVDIPDDSSPSEDSCLMEVGVGMRSRPRGGSEGGEGAEYASFRSSTQHPEGMVAPSRRRCFRGERSNSCSSPSTYNTSTYRSPVLRRQALLASSCSQLEFLAGSQHSSIPEIRVRPCTPSRRDSSSAFSNPSTTAPTGPAQERPDHAVPVLFPRPGFREQIGRDRKDSDSFLPLMRSHSEPGLSSSTDTGDFSLSGGNKGVSEGGSQTSSETGVSSGAGLLPRSSLALPASLPRKGSIKAISSRLPSKQVPATSLRLPKDCALSLGDLKVTKVLVQRFLQRSKRNLAPATEHTANCTQGTKKRTAGDGGLSLEQVLRNSLGASRGQQQQHIHHHCRGHHHSLSDSRHTAHRHDDDPVRAGGIHLRSCGDLSSTSVASLRRLHPPSHGSSGAFYPESAL